MIVAGDAGARLQTLVKAEGLTMLCAQAEGQTRTNLKIIDPVQGKNTDINEPGPAVSEEDLQRFLDMLCQKVQKNDVVVLSGSLPKGTPEDTYRRWTEQFCALGAKVFLDADGRCMAEGMQAAPYLVKPNEVELARVLNMPMQTQEQLLQGGRTLLDMGISNAVISLGAEGALFLWEDAVYRAQSLSLPVRSTVGAGDSVVAAMAYGLARNLTREEQIRLAMAIGAASVMQSGTQAPEAKTVWELAQKVVLEKLQ